MAQAASMSATERRWLSGANVTLQALMALSVLGLLIWGARTYNGRVDLTSSGQNSLSPRTVQLVKSLDRKVTMTGLFTLLAKDVRKHAEKHWNQVKDLLDLYETVGGSNIAVAMVDRQNQPQEVNISMPWRCISSSHSARVESRPSGRRTCRVRKAVTFASPRSRTTAM